MFSLIVLLFPLVAALPVDLNDKKCTTSCMNSYTNEVANAPVVYEYQNLTDVDQSQLCNYVKKMVICNGMCPDEITDEDKAEVARNFALAYLCKMHKNSLSEILDVVGNLPTSAYGECAKTCQMKDSCEKQTCFKDCLRHNYVLCDMETPCMNLITAEVFIRNFPFESNSKNAMELTEQTETHMDHIPEPSMCITSLISEKSLDVQDEVEASGEEEKDTSTTDSDPFVPAGELDVGRLLQRIKSITLHLRPIQKTTGDNAKLEVDGSTDSKTISIVSGNTEPEETAVDQEPDTNERSTTLAMIVDKVSGEATVEISASTPESAMETSTSTPESTGETSTSTPESTGETSTSNPESSVETTGESSTEASVSESTAEISDVEPVYYYDDEHSKSVTSESSNNLNVQADAAFAVSDSALAGQKEVSPTEITVEKTVDDFETTVEPTEEDSDVIVTEVDSTTEETSSGAEDVEDSSMPTIIVDDKNDMLDSNRVDGGETTNGVGSTIIGSVASLIFALVLLQ